MQIRKVDCVFQTKHKMGISTEQVGSCSCRQSGTKSFGSTVGRPASRAQRQRQAAKTGTASRGTIITYTAWLVNPGAIQLFDIRKHKAISQAPLNQLSKGARTRWTAQNVPIFRPGNSIFMTTEEHANKVEVVVKPTQRVDR